VLTGLSLENIALIQRLELTFEPGLTVLTGETGAGKSILLDALDACWADPRDLPPPGCCGAVVSGGALRPASA